MHELECPDFRLSGQVAWITGASRGIGFGIARALAHAGAKVAVAARSRGDLDGLVESICAEGGTAEAFPLDIHDLDQVRSCVAAVGGIIRTAGHPGQQCGSRCQSSGPRRDGGRLG